MPIPAGQPAPNLNVSSWVQGAAANLDRQCGNVVLIEVRPRGAGLRSLNPGSEDELSMTHANEHYRIHFAGIDVFEGWPSDGGGRPVYPSASARVEWGVEAICLRSVGHS